MVFPRCPADVALSPVLGVPADDLTFLDFVPTGASVIKLCGHFPVVFQTGRSLVNCICAYWKTRWGVLQKARAVSAGGAAASTRFNARSSATASLTSSSVILPF